MQYIPNVYLGIIDIIIFESLIVLDMFSKKKNNEADAIITKGERLE